MDVSKLLNTLRARYGVKSDTAFADLLDMQPSDICKARSGNRLNPFLILRIHERLGVSVKEIRELAGQSTLPANTTITAPQPLKL